MAKIASSIRTTQSIYPNREFSRSIIIKTAGRSDFSASKIQISPYIPGRIEKYCSSKHVLDVYVRFYKRSQPDQTQHWILIPSKPVELMCTWYPVKAGPHVDPPRDYQLEIADGKRLYSREIDKRIPIATAAESEKGKYKAAVQSVPLQHYQTFNVAVLAKLETKDMVPLGTSAQFTAQVERQMPNESRSSGAKPSETTSRGLRNKNVLRRVT